ncbi:MAG: L-threonylcarbamoyladenylate synthase [Rhodothermales bacterium]
MKTIVTDSPADAAAFLRAGEVVAFPTETVYGLGADAVNPLAVEKIFTAKGRPSDNPLIVHVATHAQIHDVASFVPASARKLIDAFFPGPLTLVLPKSERIPDVVTAGLSTVGVRMPRHPICHEFLEACGRPVAAPSANRSGRPSSTTHEAVLQDLDGRIRCVLRGGRSPVGLESTVVDCTSDPVVVLRTGAVSAADLAEVVSLSHLRTSDNAVLARSPGTRHRHYAPRGRVVLVDAPPTKFAGPAAYIGLDAPSNAGTFRIAEIAPSLEAYAHEIFDFMRRCDEIGVEVIYCQRVAPQGLGAAIMDRIRRAADAG